MTRTDVMASSRPQTAGVALKSKGSGISRRISIVTAALLLALVLVLPSTASAAGESTSGYNQKPNTPTTGTSPSKETKTPTTPSKEPSPSTTTSSPAPSTEAQKASTLPFTGFDLRWSLGVGLLLMGAGFSIVVIQRRQRRNDGS